jgi:Inheritance of peroxisomes protein 1
MATPPLSRQRPPVQAGGIRRSFTQPPRSLSFHEKAGLDPSDSAADILYSHPRARIVSFTPPTDAVRSVSSPGHTDLDYPVDTVETLPWASSTEEVLASGSLIIEKIRGSTNFLKSGTKPLHPLMRNSQCWCVDGEATLVMRVGAFKYYRIELPYATEEEKAEVQQLKDVLTKILRFEATPCPFKRGFHVDLPESATTPRKKGTWKRRPGSSLSSPSRASSSPLSPKKLRIQSHSREDVIQHEPDSSHAGIKDESVDASRGSNSLGDKDDDLQQGAAVEEDGTVARTDSNPRNGQRIPTSSASSPFIAERWRDQPPEAEDDTEENEETVGNRSVSDLSAMSDHSTGASDGQVEDEFEDKKDVDEVIKSLEDGNTPCSSSARISLAHADANPPEERCKLSGQQAEIAPENFSSVSSPLIVSDSPLQDNGNIGHDSEQSAPKDLAKPTDPQPGPGAVLQEQDIVANGERAEADEAGEIDPTLEDQPADTDEHTQPYPESPNPPTNEISIDEDSPRRDVEESLEILEPQRKLSHSDSPLSDTISVSSRADSFHSIVSSDGRSPVLEPSAAAFADFTPPVEAHDSLDPPQPLHRREISETTIIAGKRPTPEAVAPVSPLRPSTATSEDPSTPSLLRSSASDSSWPEIETPSAVPTDNDFRRRTKTKRSFSPPPPSSTLFPSSSPQSPRGSHLTGAILQKACNLALGKPIEVVVMLVHILARIAGGANLNDLMNGDLFRRPPELATAQRRNNSLPGRQSSQRGGEFEEDDYGVPIRGRSRSATPMVRTDDDADSLFDLD